MLKHQAMQPPVSRAAREKRRCRTGRRDGVSRRRLDDSVGTIGIHFIKRGFAETFDTRLHWLIAIVHRVIDLWLV
ncbi:hypothetical protein [Rhizobium sp. WYCCWR10014]|uniref:hypothetical protein n=1 Tax=Rhizobium sp. WYCCWR10014 TaxID=1825933 RepID=UPI000A6AB7E3|nr:hypothetical protein [Rhizobium sp. WYCCWR10014]